MASVTLTTVWIHDESDRSDAVQLKARNIEATPERDVRRVARAGGRVAMVSTPRRFRTVTFDALLVARTDLAWLDDRLGSLLMYRDPRGRVLHGFFAELPTAEQLWTDAAFLKLEFRAVTHSVAV